MLDQTNNVTFYIALSSKVSYECLDNLVFLALEFQSQTKNSLNLSWEKVINLHHDLDNFRPLYFTTPSTITVKLSQCPQGKL